MNKIITFLYSLLDFNRNSGHYDAQQRHDITTNFLLSGLYCAIAIMFMLFFGIQALLFGSESYGYIVLGFAGSTLFIYLLSWYLGFYIWQSHLVVGIFGFLCLFLYVTGGEGDTGPVWYLVFPVLALSIQGRAAGSVSICVLLLVTWLLSMFGFPGINLPLYSREFTQRIIAVYIAITALSYLFAYFRDKAELKLAAMIGIQENESNIDKLSGLSNRRAMEEYFEVFNETYTRFQTPFTLVIIDIEGFKVINDQFGRVFGDYVIQVVGELLKDSLRKIDIAFRLDGDNFLLLLPGTRTEGGAILVQRLAEQVKQTPFMLDGHEAKVNFRFAISEHQGTVGTEKTLEKAEELLFLAKKNNAQFVSSESLQNYEKFSGNSEETEK